MLRFFVAQAVLSCLVKLSGGIVLSLAYGIWCGYRRVGGWLARRAGRETEGLECRG